MKRYLLECVGEQGGEPVYVMRENLLGEWIRHDDPDLAALVEAARVAVGKLKAAGYLVGASHLEDALAGTTTRGRAE